MKVAGTTLVVVLFLSTGLVALGWVCILRLFPGDERPVKNRWLAGLGIKGLAVPLILWGLLNVGLSDYLQPLMPSVQAAQIHGIPWGPSFLLVMTAGVFVVASYWVALVLGWAIFSAHRTLEGEFRRDFRSLCLTSLVVMLVPAAVLFWLGGWYVAGLAVSALLLPIASYAPDLVLPRVMPPSYARATARMKFGKYPEAEQEIIHELEKRQDDFDGWLMLAELYARHFRDIGEAEHTILDICEQPRVTASQAAIALHKLADWQLELADDPEAARRTLGVICHRFAGSHLARMAQTRINQLPGSAEELREQRTTKSVPLPVLGDQLDEPDAPAISGPAARDAAKLANQLSEKLKANPDDIATREKFARVLAELLGKPDPAIEQLGLLLDMAEPPDAKRAEWMSLIAAWHLRYRKDKEAGRKALEALVRRFPESPQAFAAKQRLSLMDLDEKIRKATAANPVPPPRPRVVL
jgi:hypothetical protein